jgi:GNAT superfamily N-acetyltransferase
MISQHRIVQCNLNFIEHQKAFVKLMNAYMEDPMGKSQSITQKLANTIITDLVKHPTYIGVLLEMNGEFAALANCFENYSTFKAQPLINIHDFIVHPDYRGMGAGKLLLAGVEQIGKQRGCCRVNLEVRHDNESAMKLYKKSGFVECEPPMYFWEKSII